MNDVIEIKPLNQNSSNGIISNWLLGDSEFVRKKKKKERKMTVDSACSLHQQINWRYESGNIYLTESIAGVRKPFLLLSLKACLLTGVVISEMFLTQNTVIRFGRFYKD